MVYVPHFLTLALVLFHSLPAWADDSWPQWRGPNRDNISLEKGLLDRWEEPPQLIWKTSGIGDGHSSLVVANNVVCASGLEGVRTPGQQSVLIGLNAESGEVLWKKKLGAVQPSSGTPL